MKEIGYDKRPRFGWTDDFDKDPMRIYEEECDTCPHPCVVIPLPKITRKIRVLVRKLLGQRGDKQSGKVWV